MAERIDFLWDAEQSAQYYQLFEDGKLLEGKIVTPEFSLLMVGVAQGEHSYQVRAVNQFGEGELSDPVVIAYFLPGKVENLRFSVA